MCRNIRTLHNFEPPATRGEVHAAALQYVRKVSGVGAAVRGEPGGVRGRGRARSPARPRRLLEELDHHRSSEGPRGRGGEGPGPRGGPLRLSDDRRRDTERVAAALERTDRSDFLPAEQRACAGQDNPLAIGYGQTNSQPTTVRQMLELLDVRPGDHVLDVGCGSAWTTALLADLVGPLGDVVGVEIVPELVSWGSENLARQLRATGRAGGAARVEQARPGVLGWPDEAPYDRVLVSAEAGSLPRELVEQLASGGLMVVPVRGRMLTVRATVGGGDPEVRRHGHYRFVPLIGAGPDEPQ